MSPLGLCRATILYEAVLNCCDRENDYEIAWREVEAREQKRALKEILSVYTLDHRFKVADICRMHKIWLADLPH